MKTMIKLCTFLDFPCTYQTQRTLWMGFYVLRTKTTPEQQYLILSTSPALTTADTSSTTTTELISRSLMVILLMLTMASVKWRFLVNIFSEICEEILYNIIEKNEQKCYFHMVHIINAIFPNCSYT